MKGYFLFGQNPGGGGPNAGLHREGLRKLDWLVVSRLVRDRERDASGRTTRRARRRHEIKTEVFFIPGGVHRRPRRAASPTRSGCSSGTTRPSIPTDDCRSDAWFVYNLGKRLKALYAGSTRAAGPGASRR